MLPSNFGKGNIGIYVFTESDIKIMCEIINSMFNYVRFSYEEVYKYAKATPNFGVVFYGSGNISPLEYAKGKYEIYDLYGKKY